MRPVHRHVDRLRFRPPLSQLHSGYRDAGFRITKVRGIPAPFPKVLGNGCLARAAIAVNLALIRVSKALFSYQTYVEAESTPSVDFPLRDAKEKSAARAAKPARAGGSGWNQG